MRELQFIDYGGLSRLEFFGLSLEEMFPEDAEEDRRIKGRSKKFKSVEEISDEDIGDISVEGIEVEDVDTDDIDPEAETEYWDLISRFDDGKFDKPAFVNAVVPPEEKEDKKSISENFIPFSKTKIKCEIHKRPHGHRGRNDKYKNISRKSFRNLSLSI